MQGCCFAHKTNCVLTLALLLLWLLKQYYYYEGIHNERLDCCLSVTHES